MNHLISVRITRLFTGKESLAYRIIMVANEFGLRIKERDITDIITSINTSEVPDETCKLPSDSEFLSILVFIFVQSYITFPVCTERYLDYLDRVFQYKFRDGKLRISDILFYEVFIDRMSNYR